MHKKINNQQIEKATFGMGKNISKPYIYKGLISKIYKKYTTQ